MSSLTNAMCYTLFIQINIGPGIYHQAWYNGFTVADASKNFSLGLHAYMMHANLAAPTTRITMVTSARIAHNVTSPAGGWAPSAESGARCVTPPGGCFNRRTGSERTRTKRCSGRHLEMVQLPPTPFICGFSVVSTDGDEP